MIMEYGLQINRLQLRGNSVNVSLRVCFVLKKHFFDDLGFHCLGHSINNLKDVMEYRERDCSISNYTVLFELQYFCKKLDRIRIPQFLVNLR